MLDVWPPVAGNVLPCSHFLVFEDLDVVLDPLVPFPFPFPVELDDLEVDLEEDLEEDLVAETPRNWDALAASTAHARKYRPIIVKSLERRASKMIATRKRRTIASTHSKNREIDGKGRYSGVEKIMADRRLPYYRA